jgi:Cellulase (glycosyl hydrolase family 5)
MALVVVSGCAGSGVGATPAGGSATPQAALSSTAAATATAVTPASPAPATSPSSAVQAAAPCLAATSSGPFLGKSATAITCAGEPLPLTGFTFYPALIGGAKAWHSPTFTTYIDHVLDMGAAAGQNLIRATDQWDKTTKGQNPDDPIVWANMDYLLSAAKARGVFVVVDLSAFRWLLMSQGSDPTRADLWTGFIAKVAARYRDNPAVAFYSIAGEPAPPKNTAQMQSLLAFYRTTTEALRAADPNHLISAGGFNHMEDHPELGWWQAIDSLPVNDLVSVKTYSQHDLNLMPAIAAYGKTVGKPVFDEEFGMPQGYGDRSFSGGAPYNGLSGGRAAFFDSVYKSGASLGFAGFIFWNMGCEMGRTSYEVSPNTPAVWNVVVAHAALGPAASASSTAGLCA